MNVLGRFGLLRRLVQASWRREAPQVSEEELLAMAEAAEASDAIEPEERELIGQIIEFGDTVVREVMVPRTDTVAMSDQHTVSEAIGIVIEHGYSRVPVYAEGIDDVVGVVHAKDLMRAERDQGEDSPAVAVARTPRFVPETKRIALLLREMQAEKFHIAIVVDEYGGTAGVVTLEDLIEELVGEIVDEFDVEEPMIERLAAGTVRVNGRVPIDELSEVLAAPLPNGDWDTVGGLIFNTLGHVPEEGETLVMDGWELLVERVTGRRIARVIVKPATQSAPDG
ncbi:MAG: HlyC/CorC family transporter [Acidimicrobiia bacterium]|nr:hemolysin family protein [bacterium]MXW59216.1 HlyC/CorC family transporter [Acidimicrobiia bacterium]MDE0613052.1 hemolysin family protein [bacterium]MXZ79700.1 HlyC/CorC family transporter [Acidimicrobiia bacterium]MXZ85309.1 HlyC/CorC family transporter [Acidimicrobiia bacterium]